MSVDDIAINNAVLEVMSYGLERYYEIFPEEEDTGRAPNYLKFERVGSSSGFKVAVDSFLGNEPWLAFENEVLEKGWKNLDEVQAEQSRVLLHAARLFAEKKGAETEDISELFLTFQATKDLARLFGHVRGGIGGADWRVVRTIAYNPDFFFDYKTGGTEINFTQKGRHLIGGFYERGHGCPALNYLVQIDGFRVSLFDLAWELNCHNYVDYYLRGKEPFYWHPDFESLNIIGGTQESIQN